MRERKPCGQSYPQALYGDTPPRVNSGDSQESGQMSAVGKVCLKLGSAPNEGGI